jgi:DNA-directed RNA polymerase subunit RPC12/RpoP
MSIEFRCSQCGQMLRVADTSAGKGARCPGCKTVMIVPAADSIAGRELPSLTPFTPTPAAPPPPAPAAPPARPVVSSAQDDLFEFLKQATTPGAAPKPPPATAYEQPGMMPGTFAAAPVAAPNPYASPTAAAYPSYQPDSGERPGLPWENKPAGLGAWWETSQLCLGDAERAFRTMRQEGGIGSPMLYAVLGLLLGFMAQTLWGLPAMLIEAFGQGANPPNRAPFVGLGIGAQLAINFAIVLVWSTVGLLLSAAITHLCLTMVGGARMGYETTYRVTAFTAGSVAWLSIVPCFGPLIVFVMSLVCLIQGLTHAHETTVGKAIAAVILPWVFGCFLFVGLIIALIAVIAQM